MIYFIVFVLMHIFGLKYGNVFPGFLIEGYYSITSQPSFPRGREARAWG